MPTKEQNRAKYGTIMSMWEKHRGVDPVPEPQEEQLSPYYKDGKQLKYGELRGTRNVFLQDASGMPVRNPDVTGGVIPLMPTSPVDLALETALTALSEEKPLFGILGGFAAGQVGKVGQKLFKSKKATAGTPWTRQVDEIRHRQSALDQEMTITSQTPNPMTPENVSELSDFLRDYQLDNPSASFSDVSLAARTWNTDRTLTNLFSQYETMGVETADAYRRASREFGETAEVYRNPPQGLSPQAQRSEDAAQEAARADLVEDLRSFDVPEQEVDVLGRSVPPPVAGEAGVIREGSGNLSRGEAIGKYKGAKLSSNIDAEMDLKFDHGGKGGHYLEFKQTRGDTPNTSHFRIEIRSKSKKYAPDGTPVMDQRGGQAPESKSFISFMVEKGTLPDTGESVDVLKNFSFFASGSKAKTNYAGRLILEMFDKMPAGKFLIDEGSMTMDSFTALIKAAVKKNAKIVFAGPEGTPDKFLRMLATRGEEWAGSAAIGGRKQIIGFHDKQSHFAKKFAEGAKKARETGDDKYIDEAVDYIMDGWRKILKDSKADVSGELGAKFISTSEGFEINAVQIHKFSGAIAGSLGLDNIDEFKEFLAYDRESVESKVLDSEISF